ncbi:MAG: urease accessory protein UreF [Candidatus Nitrosomaritimum yanchengensis]
MNIEEIEQELSGLQLSDSFFPTGIYASSNGLEFLFSRKKILNAANLTEIIRINITQQVGPSDCIALANTFDEIQKGNFNEIIKTDEVLFSSKSIKENRDASVRSGVQLVKCVCEFVKNNEVLNQYKKKILENKVHGIFPVAFAVCCSALEIKKEKSMIMFLYGFIVMMIGAALRLGLIQHFEGQKIIHSLKPTIGQTIKEYSDKSINEMWQFAPQIDIVQMSHEKMDSKMFIT